MSDGTKGHEARRGIFEEWQWQTDALYQQWMQTPLALRAMSLTLNNLLGLWEAQNRLYEFCFNSSQPLSATLDEFANLQARYTEASLEMWRAATGSSLLPSLAATPFEVVYREDKLRVLHYKSAAKVRHATPLLIVNSLVNRYYILDLTPERSYVAYLLKRGFDVYLIDWGFPDATDAKLTLEDYVDRYMSNVARAVIQHSGTPQFSLLGYSMGGTLSLCYTALHPRQVKNLILLGTPVDFDEAGLVGALTDRRYFDVERLVTAFGNVPAEMLRWSFLLLKPTTNATKFLNLLEQLGDEEALRNFLAVEIWTNDSVPIPGEFYRRFVKDFYQDNLLAKGKLKIGGRAVDLSRVRCPVLNCIGTKDQNVLPASSMRLKDLISSRDQEELLLPYGHIMLTVSAHAEKDLWAKSAAWLARRSMNIKASERIGKRKKTTLE